jgi:4-diphosphocytidyl-2-C-methyl-D-erythritol kinase
VTRAPAYAKINLALVAGPRRKDGFHEIATVLQRIELADTVHLEPADAGITVAGFPEDTLVRRALEAVGGAWNARIEKRIPVAAGLGGGSSDAATALRLACPDAELHDVAAQLGSDVPFFLAPGPQLARGRGTDLSPLELPQDYTVVVIVPEGSAKASTAAVYAAFDGRGGEAGFRERVAVLERALEDLDLAALPPNDLVSSPLAQRLLELGAFRADVTGAGPAVYGLFVDAEEAARAAAQLEGAGQLWVSQPAW